MKQYKKELPNIINMKKTDAIKFLDEQGYSHNEYNFIYKISFFTKKDHIIKINNNNIYISSFNLLPIILLLILLIIIIIIIIFINKSINKINSSSIPPIIYYNNSSNYVKNAEIKIEKEAIFNSTTLKSYQYCISSKETTQDCTWNDFNIPLIIEENGINNIWIRGVSINYTYTNPSNKIKIKIDTKGPNVKISSSDIKNNNITYKIDANDEGSGISSYYYSINNSEYIKDDNKHTFKSLKYNTTYKINIKVTDKLGNQTIIEDYKTTSSKPIERTTSRKTIKTTEKSTKVIKYKISFVTGTNDLIEPIEYIKGTNLNLPIPSRAGYTFVGWLYENELIDNNYNIQNDLTLIATWNPIIYTINIDLDGGILEYKNTYTIEDENYILPYPTKLGYTFIGYTGTDYKDITHDIKIYTDHIGNKNYKALYEPNKYNIIYHDTSITDNIYKEEYIYDQEYKIKLLDNKDNLIFKGWKYKIGDKEYIIDTNNNIKNIISEGSIDLYSIWESKGSD